MKPFIRFRTQRNTAFVALLVWLFALVSGAANACLIQPEKMHDHGTEAAHSPAAEKGHAISAVPGDAIPDHDSGLETSKSQCLKVCDDSSQSLPKQQVGFDLIHPVLVPLLAVAVTGAQTWAATTAAQDTCHPADTAAEPAPNAMPEKSKQTMASMDAQMKFMQEMHNIWSLQ